MKSGDDGERWISLDPNWFQPLVDYLDEPDRLDETRDYGREPLRTTEESRPVGDTVYSWVTKLTQPCRIGPVRDVIARLRGLLLGESTRSLRQSWIRWLP